MKTQFGTGPISWNRPSPRSQPDPGDLPIKVLLVDDDEEDYILTRDLLFEIDRHRYRLDWVSDYGPALEAIGRGQHEVYLTRIPHLAQTSDAVNRQLSCFSSRYMNLLAVFQI